MSAERIFWIVVGIIAIICAILVLVTDQTDVSQKTMDGLQVGAIGLLALGMAYRSR